ncbi:MAG: hypothetical protein AAFO07_27015, partial [Bacteroidota bacterium]
YQLQGCSPLINAGIRDSIFEKISSELDLAGNPRLLEGLPDIGAYEQQSLGSEFKIDFVRFPSCHDSEDGQVSFSTSDNIPYQIQWEDTLTRPPLVDQLGAGEYNFIITNTEGCTDTIYYQLTAPDSLQVEYSIFPAQSPSSNDGSILIDRVEGGTPPYQFSVLKEDTVLQLSNLFPGNYELLVTDNRNCQLIVPFEVSFMTSTNDLKQQYGVEAFPNPVQHGGNLSLKLPTDIFTEWQLKDLMGRLIDFGKLGKGDTELSTVGWSTGHHTLFLQNKKGERVALPLVVY